MKKLILLLMLIGLGQLTQSCSEERVLLKGCCDEDGIWGDAGNATVFVPNIFTPNEDGANDRLTVYSDSVSLIKEFVIKNKKGDVVYEILNVSPSELPDGWDGRVNGKVELGLFSTFLTVISTNGITESFEGKVCNYACNLLNSPEIIIDPINCKFDDIWFSMDPTIDDFSGEPCFH